MHGILVLIVFHPLSVLCEFVQGRVEDAVKWFKLEMKRRPPRHILGLLVNICSIVGSVLHCWSLKRTTHKHDLVNWHTGSAYQYYSRFDLLNDSPTTISLTTVKSCQVTDYCSMIRAALKKWIVLYRSCPQLTPTKFWTLVITSLLGISIDLFRLLLRLFSRQGRTATSMLDIISRSGANQERWLWYQYCLELDEETAWK